MPRRDVVTWANESISIFDLLQGLFGVDAPREGGSFKIFCPFSFEHPDGGVERACRTYPETNSAYCFALHGRLTPVKLYALAKDLRYKQAAVELLRRAGLYDPRPWKERLPEVLAEREAAKATRTDLGDPQTLVAALHTSLRSHPAYPVAGVSPALSGALEARMALLEGLSGVEAVRTWYDESKKVLWEALDQEARTA